MFSDKLINVVLKIHEQINLTAHTENTIFLHPSSFRLIGTSMPDLEAILNKLSADHEVLEVMHYPTDILGGFYLNKNDKNECFELKINRDKFEEYFRKHLLLFQKQSEMLEQIKRKNSKAYKNDSLYITYSEHNQKIIINDRFLLATPDFNSENEQVFHYLYRNPNKVVTREEVEENVFNSETLTKNFNKIVENLHFKKELRNAFFDVSANTIKFHNPVPKERLRDLGIKHIKIVIK
jgi:hypothetical protein